MRDLQCYADSETTEFDVSSLIWTYGAMVVKTPRNVGVELLVDKRRQMVADHDTKAVSLL